MLYLRSLTFFVIHNVSGMVTGVFAVLIWPLLPYAIRWRIITQWNRFTLLLLRLCCGIKLQIIGKVDKSAYPCVIVANHQSTWETMFLQHYFGPVSTILKKELLRIPFFGWGLATMRPIAIDRSNPIQALKDVKTKGLARLKQGNNLLIFPEGTRVPPGKKLKYARSAADIACTAGVPVIPVAHNGAECWPHKTLIKYPGTITVVVGDPVPVAGRDRKELTDYLQNWIEAQRDAMPTGRADGKRPWQTAEPE